VLLSSIEGSAVVALKVSGALLEFSTIPGVYEDITDVVLNLKALSLNLHGSEPRTFTVSAKGPCVVTASMIQGGGVDILDPNQVICTLSDTGLLEMELTVARGKGYVPTAPVSAYGRRNVGEIMLDAQFSPIKRVNYTVENSWVGQHADYDRLLLTVKTNGSISPKDAISAAASIMQDQLSRFVTLEETLPVETSGPSWMEGERNKVPFPMVFLKNVKDLDLSVRCLNCLKNEGIVYVGDLVKKQESDLLKTPNFGRKSLTDINDVLSRLGLKLGMDCPEWPPEDLDKYLKETQQDLETR
jgi:DNA-directed RNA polymerase subunit alpha